MINGKKILGLTASVVLIAGAAACGGSGNKTTTGGASSNSGSSATAAAEICDGSDITLTVWAPAEDLGTTQKQDADGNDVVSTDEVTATTDSWLATQEAAFLEANSSCKITWKNAVVSEADAASAVELDPASAADVYLFANDQLGRLVNANAIGEFQGDYLSQIQAANSESIMTSVTNNGKVYGSPYTSNTWYMYYDSSVFTADDVKSLDTMLEKGKVSFPLTNAWYLWSFYAGAGATLYGDGTDESASPVAVLGDNAAKVTEYLVNLRNNSNFVLDDNGTGKSGLQDGTVNAMFSGSWDITDVKAALGDNYAAAQPPTFNLDGTETQMKAFFGSKAAAYNPQSNNVAPAMAFAVYLSSADAQKSHFTKRSIIPSSTELSSDADISAEPAVAAQNGAVATGVVQPTFSSMSNPNFWDPVANFGKAIYNGDVTTSNAADQTTSFEAGLFTQA